jgi:Ran GTPase-activating protein (RanGAP) involved in mRNA processing and transport
MLKTDQCHLSALDLQYNEITDAGGELLGEALESNRYLLSLNMTGNEIGETTGKVILESMRTNKYLRHLHLEKNYIKPLLLSLI